MTPRARSFARVIALIAWAGLVLQVVTAVQRGTASGTTPSLELWRLLGYFTILTNTIVAVIFTVVGTQPADDARTVVGGAPSEMPWWSRPGFLSALTVHIVFVGVAYSVLLRSSWQPHGLEIAADEIVHDIIPLMVLVYWWRHVPKGTLAVAQLPRWLAYPLAYLLYVLARGAAEGWYPYYFLDVSRLGYAGTLRVAFAIMLVLSVMSLTVLMIDRRLSPRAATG